MDEGSPTLEVGFAIETGGSYDELTQLQQVMSSTEAKIVADAANIERATGGMVKLASATTSIRSFGNATTKEAQSAAVSLASVERAGERLSRQLERDVSTFGKTRSEIRLMKVEAAALAAEQQGLSELAARLRAQEEALSSAELVAARKARFEAEAAAEEKQLAADKAAAAAEAEAKAVRDAANAYRIFQTIAKQRMAEYNDQQAADAAAQMRAEAAAAKQLAAEHERLAAMVRGSHDAQEADAAAAERMRIATDPLYAATKRLNAEIAESTRLYYSGATAPAEYARQQEVLVGRLRAVQAQEEAINRGLGTVGATGKLAGFHMQNLAFQFQDLGIQMFAAAQSSAPLKMGIMALVQQGSQIGGIMGQAGIGIRGVAGAFGQMSKSILLATVTNPVLLALAGTVTLFAATVTALNRAAGGEAQMKRYAESLGLTAKEIRGLSDVTITWGDTAKAVFQVGIQRIASALGVSTAEISRGWNAFLDDLASATKTTVAGIYASFATLAKMGSFKGFIETFAKGGGNPFAGLKKQFNDSYQDAQSYFADVMQQRVKNAQDRIRGQAEDKGYFDSDKAKTDQHAAQLAREAAATEAQIKNLYALADAYNVSGAAALIAEAREKAESAAIKKRADIDAAVARQIRLAIAQRVADAAKSTAALRDQTAIQKQVNEGVAAGNILAGQANQFVQDRIADLPLLAAIEAAKQTKDVKGIQEATDALEKQRQARLEAADAQSEAERVAAMQAGKDQLEMLSEELRLIGATDAARVHALATLKAEQEARAKNWTGQKGLDYVQQQVAIADATERAAAAQRDLNDALSFAADRWDLIAANVQAAGQGMADAFGSIGRAIGDMASVYASFHATRERLDMEHAAKIKEMAGNEAALARENQLFALRSATLQIGAFGDMAAAAKGFFKEGTDGYKALQKAEQVFRAIQFALSVRAMAQDAVETVSSIAKSGARAAALAVEAVAKAISSLPFPLNLVAGAATAAALASIGISIAGAFGGGGKKPSEANTGTGTVLGDASAKSDSIKNAIDALKEVDTVTNTFAREMANSLKSIDSQIGSLATVLVRAGDINASEGVTEGFKKNLIGSILGSIPLIGGLLGGLFGTKTKVIGSGIYGGAQSLDDILSGGFSGSTYSDIQKKKKFFGITTGTKYSTQYGSLDPALANQFTLILKSFNDAIAAAAGPLGEATDTIQSRLNSFVLNIGKIDLQGLTGEEIQDKLTAIFGAAADSMANAAFPGIAQFQKVGEGAFETLVRVASTLEQVSASLDLLGQSAQGMGIAAKLGLADQFDSVSALNDAVGAYFQTYYSKEEQAAAKTAQMGKVFDSLGLSMPSTLAGFRALVEAQDLTTAAGQETYATLLKLAPAFADLQSSMEGAKSAADILSERQDLQRQLLELEGNTAAIRALDLAKLDESNRALQQQIWALQDAQDAAKAAQDLADAWKSVGDSIMDEINRIRGLSDTTGSSSFATLMGQFNAATAAARGGDMDAAKTLPQLSQALLTAAQNAATSRQELDRIKAQVAASLEATYGLIGSLSMGSSTASISTTDLLTNGLTSQPATVSANDNSTDSLAAKLDALRDEVAQMRTENNSGHAATAGNTGSIKKTLDNVTLQSGGDAISTVAAA